MGLPNSWFHGDEDVLLSLRVIPLDPRGLTHASRRKPTAGNVFQDFQQPQPESSTINFPVNQRIARCKIQRILFFLFLFFPAHFPRQLRYIRGRANSDCMDLSLQGLGRAVAQLLEQSSAEPATQQDVHRDWEHESLTVWRIQHSLMVLL